MNDTFVTIITVILTIIVAITAIGCIYYENHGEDADLSKKEEGNDGNS